MFVSSTFRDMHAERDHLNRHVFPELRARCQLRGAEFLAVDLRWGATAEQVNEQGAVSLSLEALERCRPYFLCLLGDRYGTVPLCDEIAPDVFERARDGMGPELQQELDALYARDDSSIPPRYRRRRDRNVDVASQQALIRACEDAGQPLAGASITAREIERAVFQDGFRPLAYPRGNGLYRDPRIPRALLTRLQDRDPWSRQRLDDLKRRLQHACPDAVHDYEVGYRGVRLEPTMIPDSLAAAERALIESGLVEHERWDELSPGLQHLLATQGTLALDGLDALGERVLHDLWSSIEPELPQRAGGEGGSPRGEARAHHERFLRDRAALLVGRGPIVERIVALAADDAQRRALLITGPAGSGKSAVLAEVTRRCRERFPAAVVLPYFLGAAPGSTDLSMVLRAVWDELRDAVGISEPIPTDPQVLIAKWPSFLSTVSELGRPIFLILDGLDHIDTGSGQHRAGLLPPELPAGIRLLASATHRDVVSGAGSDAVGPTEIALPPLTPDDRAELVTAFLRLRHKRLTGSQLSRLLGDGRETALPLYLVVALQELCLFGDFERLSERIDQLAPTVEGLFRQVLMRIEQDHGRALAERVVTLLSVSRSGLLESEILELAGAAMPLPALQWRRLYRSLEPYLRPLAEGDGLALIGFFHDQLRQAVNARYLPGDDPARTQAAHDRLAVYFEQRARGGTSRWRAEEHRALAELPFHLLGAGRLADLEATLTDLGFVEARCRAGSIADLVYDHDLAARSAHDAIDVVRLRKQRELVVRDSRNLAQFASVPGFVRQQWHNAGLTPWQRRAGDEQPQPWFEILYSSERSDALIATLEGHSGAITDCMLSDRGDLLVLCSADGSVVTWDTASWQRRDIVAMLPHGVTTCDISADGSLIVTGAKDGLVRVHRTSDHGAVVCDDRLSGMPRRCRFVPGVDPTDGERVLCAGEGGLIVHDARSGRALVRHVDPALNVHDVALAPTGIVALACHWGGIRIYDPTTGQIVTTLNSSGMVNVFGCVFSGDGRFLIGVGGNDLYQYDVKPYGLTTMWRTDDWKEVNAGRRQWPHLAVGCCRMPGDARCAVGFYHGEVAFLDFGDGSAVHTLKAHSQHVRALTAGALPAAPSEVHLVTGSGDGQIKVWREAALSSQRDAAAPGQAIFAAFSHDRPQASVWFARTRNFECEFQRIDYDFAEPVAPSITRRALEHDYQLRRIGIFGHDLALDMPRTAAHVSAWRVGSRTCHASSPFSDWGDYWLIACSARLSPHAFHLVPELPDALNDLRNYTWARSVSGMIALLRYRTLLITGSRRGGVAWRIELPETRRFHAEPQVLFSADARRVYCSRADALHVVDATGGHVVAAFGLPDASITSISESHSGQELVIAGDDGSLRTWQWRSQREAQFAGHTAAVRDATYLSDRWLVSVGRDGTVRLWEHDRAEPRAVLVAGTALSAFAISPVESRLVVAGINGEVHLLAIEGIDQALQREPRARPGAPEPTLAASQTVMRSVLEHASMPGFLAPELANIGPVQRAVMLCFLAHIVVASSPYGAHELVKAARALEAELSEPFDLVLRDFPRGMLAMAREVEPKQYGPGETIGQISQVVRGAARIVVALEAGQLQQARDIAVRFLWPHTRRVLLAGIHGAAMQRGAASVARQIALDLDVGGDVPR